MQPVRLPAKFNLSLVDGELKDQLDAIFRDHQSFSEMGFRAVVPGKEYVVSHPNLPHWIVKGIRTDDQGPNMTVDTHIYRVRRALRIAKIIEKCAFTKVVVPHKYLYQNQGQWYVIAEKLPLDPILSLSIEEKKNRKYLSVEQTKELAVICFEAGLLDVDGNNLRILADGRIAIIDTEPIDRKKRKATRLFYQFVPGSKSFFNLLVAAQNTERLAYLSISQDKEIIPIQARYLWRFQARCIAQIALSTILSVGLLIIAKFKMGGFIALVVPVAIGGAFVSAMGLYYLYRSFHVYSEFKKAVANDLKPQLIKD